MKDKIVLMLQVYRERLENAQRPPIDYVLCIRTEAQIAILENLYIYELNEESIKLRESGNSEKDKDGE